LKLPVKDAFFIWNNPYFPSYPLGDPTDPFSKPRVQEYDGTLVTFSSDGMTRSLVCSLHSRYK